MFGRKIDHRFSVQTILDKRFILGLKILAQRADIVFSLANSNLKKPLRIAVVAPSSPSDFFGLMWKGIWSAACELAPFGVRLDSFETAGHDLTAQRRIIANIRDNPPAALAIVPAHISDLNPQLAQLSDLEVPVITFHTDAPASVRKFYVGTDPANSGALAGEMLAILMRGKGTVASFPGSLETEHLKQRYLAFRKQLKLRAPEIKESFSHSGYNGLAEAVERALNSGQEVSGIYVGCSRAHTVARVLSQSGLQIPCIGFDLTELSRPFLASGVLSAMIDENVYHQGYIAVQLAFETIPLGIAKPADERISVSAPLQPTVMLGVGAADPEMPDFGTGFLDGLIRMRTQRAVRYQTLLSEASSRMTLMSETDPLTGLLNRIKFEEQLSARVKDQKRLSILMISLDGSEQNVAQPIGDEAVQAVAKTLRTLARPQDDCARIGGNEFSILMPGADPSEAAAARERILTAIAKTVIAPQTLHLCIQVSVGAASLPEDASNAEDLLVRADNSMYAHKRAASSPSGQPHYARAFSSSSTSAGTTWNKSPTIP
jgi:LacI family transcriptional regulator